MHINHIYPFILIDFKASFSIQGNSINFLMGHFHATVFISCMVVQIQLLCNCAIDPIMLDIQCSSVFLILYEML